MERRRAVSRKDAKDAKGREIVLSIRPTSSCAPNRIEIFASAHDIVGQFGRKCMKNPYFASSCLRYGDCKKRGKS